MKLFRALLIALLLSSSFYSCEDKNENTGVSKTEGENQSVNKWIYEEMEFYYFWNDKLPTYSSLNLKSEPQKFFFDLFCTSIIHAKEIDFHTS